ncbi:ribosome-inactivating protein [Tanacetum coccineum]
MLSEAVRIRYIELVIRQNMLGDNPNFFPDARAISMENKWSKLSKQVQCSGKSRIFLTGIEVRSVSDNVVLITSVASLLRQAALDLMLYKQPKPKAIRMPVPVAVVGADDEQWILYNAGTIMNLESSLVIAAETSTQGTTLKVAQDNNSSRQAWSVGNYTQPTINYISGFSEMCLQANGANTHVWLANCVIGTEPRQQWALYGDNTIRPYSDRTICVTSDGHESLAVTYIMSVNVKSTI